MLELSCGATRLSIEILAVGTKAVRSAIVRSPDGEPVLAAWARIRLPDESIRFPPFELPSRGSADRTRCDSADCELALAEPVAMGPILEKIAARIPFPDDSPPKSTKGRGSEVVCFAFCEARPSPSGLANDVASVSAGGTSEGDSPNRLCRSRGNGDTSVELLPAQGTSFPDDAGEPS